MSRAFRRYRIAVSTPLATLMLALGVAVPVMERADFARAPVVESEHEPGTCPTPHDHTVCTQVGANHAAPGRDGARRSSAVVRDTFGTPPTEEARDARVSRSVSARAPPRA
jgi:hypothetical protein